MKGWHGEEEKRIERLRRNNISSIGEMSPGRESTSHVHIDCRDTPAPQDLATKTRELCERHPRAARIFEDN